MSPSKRILIPLAILFILAASAFAWMAYSANEKEKAKQARGIHHDGPIHVQNNNTYLPGLDSNGKPKPATQPAATQPQPKDSWKSPQPSTPASAPATWPSTAPTTNSASINSDDFLFSSSQTQPDTRPSNYPGPGGYTGSDF